jgi:hypothetical protein
MFKYLNLYFQVIISELMEESDELIKAKILRVLVRKEKWLHAHTPLTNIVKWVVVRRNGKRGKEVN